MGSLRSLFLTWLFCVISLHLIKRYGYTSDFLSNYSLVFNFFILAFVPILVTWKRRPPIPLADESLGKFANSLGLFVLAVVAIFPLITLCTHFISEFYLAKPLNLDFDYTGILLKEVPYQLLAVAIPEEIFFRSYLQNLLNDHFGKPFKIFGIHYGWGLILASAIFALSHSLVSFQWWHFSIFFPSLIFGLLFEKTNSLTASVLFHALANLWMKTVYLYYGWALMG